MSSTAEAPPRRVREKDLQRQIVDFLRVQGYEVLQLGAFRQRTRCAACGHEGYLRGATSSFGVPDLLVWCRDLAGPVAICLELKTRTGRPTKDQQRLAELGMTRIVRSIDDVAAVLLELGLPVRFGVGAP